MKHRDPNRALSSIVFIACLLGAAVVYGEVMYRHGTLHCEATK